MSTLATKDGLELQLHVWGPEDKRATVALLHGYGEHAERYAHVADAWAKDGIRTIAVDLRGHGKSPGTRGYVERFTDYHHDANALTEAAQKEGGPVFLFGHSMGGLLALHYVLETGGKGLSGMALSSPYLGLALEVPKLKQKAGRVMSRLYPKLALPSGLKGEDVTRDPEKAKVYDADPLNNKDATARWFTEAMSAIDSVLARAGQIQTPTLLLYGGEDKVAKADAADTLASRLAMDDRETERLAGYYHELVNEPLEYREPVIARYKDWFLSRA